MQQEIYDGRLAFEAVDTGAGRNAMVNGLDTLPPLLLQGLMSDGIGTSAAPPMLSSVKAGGSAASDKPNVRFTVRRV